MPFNITTSLAHLYLFTEGWTIAEVVSEKNKQQSEPHKAGLTCINYFTVSH